MKKAIIITGANSGIGFEAVQQFLQLTNVVVIAISRNVDNLQLLSAENLQIQQCDISDFEALKLVINQINQNENKIDLLINSAGVAYRCDLLDTSHAKNMEMIDINAKGTTNMLELILPIMCKNNSGTIINMSSLSDRSARPTVAVYASTKAYIKSLSESLRLQMAKYNIRVVNVAPAPVDTKLFAGLGVTAESINVVNLVNILKFIYQQPQELCIRDIVIAPTQYEG